MTFRDTVSRDFQRSPVESETGSIGRRTLGPGLLPNADHDPAAGRYDVPDQVADNLVRVFDECRIGLCARRTPQSEFAGLGRARRAANRRCWERAALP